MPTYYDSPEGEDVFTKLWCTMKYATLVGVTVSSLDVLLYSHPKGYAKTLGRYVYFTGPLVGMAAAFTATTFMATNMRQKDDKINYILGSCAAGGVFGAWQRSPVAALWGCLALTVAGVLKKSSIQDGWLFIPNQKPPAVGSLTSWKQDWTVTKDRPGTWTTGN